MSETALRILKSLGNKDADRMIEASNVELVRPVIDRLDSIISKYDSDEDRRKLIVDDFEEWFKSFISGL